MKTRFFLFAALAVMVVLSCDKDDKGKEDVPPSIYDQVVRNPYLASDLYSITHFNSAQTDAFPYSVKSGSWEVNPDECKGISSGPVNLMTLASADPDYMWAMSSDRVSYVRIAGGAFEKVADAELPNIKKKSEEELRSLVQTDYKDMAELEENAKAILGQMPQLAMANGNYVLCDKDNYAYTNARTVICRYKLKNPADPAEGIVLDRTLDMAPYFKNTQKLVGMVMTYDGHLVVVAGNGIAVLDRDMKKEPVVKFIQEDQDISNSVAVDENNGIYVASGSKVEYGKGVMRKYVWKNGMISDDVADGAWEAEYDGGPAAPAIKMGHGAGSTPTLMGFGDAEDKLVVITDGAQRMKIVAFWRDGIPAGIIHENPENPRVAGSMEISCGLPESAQWVQSEQSVAVNGYGAFVVNNVIAAAAKDKIVSILAIGPLIDAPYGVERVAWDVEKNEWRSVWTRPDVSSVSMIPSVSTASNMVFVNGYSKTEGWDVSGLDWNTGATLHKVKFGKNNKGNGAYAVLQYMEDGDLLFNSVSGAFRVDL